MITALKKVYITKDGKSLVSFGHPKAAVLLYGKGQQTLSSKIEKYEVEEGLFANYKNPKAQIQVESKKAKTK